MPSQGSAPPVSPVQPHSFARDLIIVILGFVAIVAVIVVIGKNFGAEIAAALSIWGFIGFFASFMGWRFLETKTREKQVEAAPTQRAAWELKQIPLPEHWWGVLFVSLGVAFGGLLAVKTIGWDYAIEWTVGVLFVVTMLGVWFYKWYLDWNFARLKNEEELYGVRAIERREEILDALKDSTEGMVNDPVLPAAAPKSKYGDNFE